VIVEGGKGDNTMASHTGYTPPPLVPDREMKRVVLCAGKIFYHLHKERKARDKSKHPIQDITLGKIGFFQVN
jgi:2-oxoglutarate dehydrogenase complex dehydrogenase (E1) component-like enzyme